MCKIVCALDLIPPMTFVHSKEIPRDDIFANHQHQRGFDIIASTKVITRRNAYQVVLGVTVCVSVWPRALHFAFRNEYLPHQHIS